MRISKTHCSPIICAALLSIALVLSSLELSAQRSAHDKSRLNTTDDYIPIERSPSCDSNVLASHIVYPKSARDCGFTGTVVVRVEVDTNGRVRRSIIEKAAHPLLDSAAVKALRATTFIPAMVNNHPIYAWNSFPIVFSLQVNDARNIPAAFDTTRLHSLFGIHSRHTKTKHLHARVRVNAIGQIQRVTLYNNDKNVTSRFSSLTRAIRTTAFFPSRVDGLPRNSELEIEIDLPVK